MGGKLLPILIVISLVIVVCVGVFIFAKVDHDPTPPDPINNFEEPPSLTINQEVNEEGGVVVVSADTSESLVEVNKITILNLSGEIIDETEGSSASFEVSENGKYKVVAYAVNDRTATKTINVTEVPAKRKSNPYQIEGFKVMKSKEKEIGPDDGYVIVDDRNNQYVWVPVESGNLTRNTAYEADYEDDASELTNSVSKYYGFYISRFEASRAEYDEGVAASVQGKMPWTEVDYNEAQTASKRVAEVLGYEECSTSLMSSYAWDTTLDWIDKDSEFKDFSQSTDRGNYDGTVVATGTTSSDNVKNICDLAGNVKEWTTEIDKSLTEQSAKKSKDKKTTLFRMVRGGSAELATTPASRSGYTEDSTNISWGFRYILYKN